MPNVDRERLVAKAPRRITVGVFLDEGPADHLDQASMARLDARAAGATAEELEQLDASVTAAQAALDDATVWLTFQSIGRARFARLVAEHPPAADAAAEQAWNPVSFPPALIHAALLAPELTVEDVDALFAEDSGWNEAELGALFAAALAVNTAARPLRVRADP